MRVAAYLTALPKVARFAALTSIAIGLGITLGGCSSARQNQQASWVGANPPVPAPSPQQSAYVAEPGDPIKEPPVEPGKRPNAAPDDPAEPYSPNYGGPRNRPPVQVSDAAPGARDPEPQGPQQRRIPDASRAYFKRTMATASAD
jgi:hypothetical protein